MLTKNSKMGQGTYGIVYSATDSDTGELLAVKRNTVDKTISFAASIRELELLLAVQNHPCITSISEVVKGEIFGNGNTSPIKVQSRKDDTIHFVMELAEASLDDVLYYKEQNELTRLQRLRIICHSLLGLEYLHSKGILHRDIKSGNVLLWPDGSAKLCDLGLAERCTIQGEMDCGACPPWYGAPESYTNDYSFPIDLWSMGIVAYETLYDCNPFTNCEDVIEVLLSLCPVGTIDESYPEEWTQYPKPVKYLLASVPEEDQPLINGLITWDPKERLTAGEALALPLFEPFREEIAACRLESPPEVLGASLTIKQVLPNCIERTWAGQIIFDLHEYFLPRACFHTLELFSRYLCTLREGMIKTSTKKLESDQTGTLLAKEQVKVCLASCMYLALKYFSVIILVKPFPEVAKYFKLPNSRGLIARAAQFEEELLKNLQYQIYLPTPYEAADHYLQPDEIKALLKLYGLLHQTREEWTAEEAWEQFSE